MTTPTPCPDCGHQLQRLEGRDGYQVARVFDRWSIREQRRLDVVYACTACEHVAVNQQAA